MPRGVGMDGFTSLVLHYWVQWGQTVHIWGRLLHGNYLCFTVTELSDQRPSPTPVARTNIVFIMKD